MKSLIFLTCMVYASAQLVHFRPHAVPPHVHSFNTYRAVPPYFLVPPPPAVRAVPPAVPAAVLPAVPPAIGPVYTPAVPPVLPPAPVPV
ncbi:pollen-specific leucine-rich repeat extensin-like protein 2 [Cimex lectularius]|uniref:CPR type cuticle protein n=1 Tax=Cimex lectularius TaxID=79782 RepID=A0A8I6RIW2_CIMLE|nr:pollen-specific leucine-rich repeat extensin-like protein 2 [Cimex lectularius]